MTSWLRLATGVVLVLHGLVHLWYVALAQGWVEFEEEMGWTGTSWLLSPVLSREVVLALASALYVLVALGFVVGGVGYVLGGDWWPTVVLGSAVLSAVVIVATWDGSFDRLVEKGAVGVLVDVVVAYLVLAR